MKKILLVILPVLFFACQSQPQEQEQQTESVTTMEDSLTAVIANGKANAKTYYARAGYYYDNRLLKEAQADIDTALSMDSSDVEIWQLHGQVYYMTNRTRISRSSWERCAELDPKNIQCRQRLAELYLAVRDYPQALKKINEVLQLDSRLANALFLKGFIYQELGDTTLAISFYTQTIDADENYFDAYDMLGVIYAERGDSLALQFYNKTVELRPNSSDQYYKIGIFEQNRGNFNEAIEAYTKATQANNKNKNAYFNLGYIHLELDLNEQAAAYFTRAIEADDRYFQAYYARGYAFESMSRFEDAKRDYETALNINMEYQAAKDALLRVSRILEGNY
jgi:tetratricopeptide (TPR) repeat protein